MPPDDVFTETDGGHVRMGTRTTSIYRDMDYVSNFWPGAAAVIKVGTRHFNKTEGKYEAAQSRYFITGRNSVKAEDFSRWIRAHWGIENRLHWVLDMAFNAWAGGHEFPEPLAALTLPFAPVVDEIMADLLRAVGIDKPEEEGIWPEYDAEPQATLHLLRELWNTIQRHRTKYNLPPEDGVFDICAGQRIRIPSIIKEWGNPPA